MYHAYRIPLATDFHLGALASGRGNPRQGNRLAQARGKTTTGDFAFANALDLPKERFEKSWASLDRVGNLSSSAVLHVLADTIDGGVAPGGSGLLFALGPGVSAEFVLLEWPA